MSTENVLNFRNTRKQPSKIVQWLDNFKTPSGRRFSRYFMGGLTLVIPSIFTSYQTFFVEDYLDYFLREYRNGIKFEVPEELEELIDTAADRVQLKVIDVAFLRSYMDRGVDIKTIGSMKSNCYGWIGIPVNYLYKSVNDIERNNLQFQMESIDWNSEQGQLLQKSLILTEEEKLFGITRSIIELLNYNHVHSALVPAFLIFGLLETAQRINYKFKLFHQPRGVRVVTYGILSLFTYGIYSVITDTIHLVQTTRIDKALVALGTDVMEAGIGFYEKVLNKNKAIRALSGMDLYSVDGNEYTSFLRFNVFPLTVRKQFLETSLKEAQQKKDAYETGNKTIENPTDT